MKFSTDTIKKVTIRKEYNELYSAWFAAYNSITTLLNKVLNTSFFMHVEKSWYLDPLFY